tara:strand:- start:1348 stop:1719 length:372 start_codon:yes stop_codon:yes gene_type:complete
MNDIHKRIFLFLVLCIGTRSLLVYLAKTVDKEYLQYMGILALIPAIGFITIYLLDLRKKGAEVFESKIWWNDFRPIHGVLYLLFAVYAIKKEQDYAWIPLLIDVLIGLLAFLHYHYNSGNLNF